MKKKLTSQQETTGHQQALTQGETQQTPREFGSVEEMLRHDSLHTPVPPLVTQRLQKSIAQLPAPPARSWWRRLFGSPEE